MPDVDLTMWPSGKGLVKIRDMHHSHLVSALHYVENKAAYAIKQLTFLSGVIHVDLVSMVPPDSELRLLIAPQYAALQAELVRRAAESLKP